MFGGQVAHMIAYERSFSWPRFSELEMNAIGVLIQQLDTVNTRFHHVTAAVTPDLMTASIAPGANQIGFLLWHMARSQDWGIHTAVRGVPELAWGRPWSEIPGINTPGIGTGFSQAEAEWVAGSLELPSLIAYADAVHAAIVPWVRGLAERDLDEIPDLSAHLGSRPEYHTPGFEAEIGSGPEHDKATAQSGGQPTWLYITSVAITHLHRHLGEVDLTLGVKTGRAG